MGKADLHMHTTYSWDGTSTVSGMLKQAALAGLDIVAITDHDAIQGSLEAVQMAAQYGLQAIPGSEISTKQGHLLALFIQKKIPAGLPMIDTLLRVGEQDGLGIIAHPMARFTSSASPETIYACLSHPGAGRVLVGLEVFNAGLIFQNHQPLINQLAHDTCLAQVGNSDAHVAWAIGGGQSIFPGFTPTDLRRALLQRTTQVVRSHCFTLRHIFQSWAPRYLLRRAGWVTTNIHPENPLALGRP